MTREFLCEVCDGRDAKILGVRKYSIADAVGADKYTRVRLRVLFDIWCTKITHVTFTAVMCTTCGFVCHLPRAGFADVHAKYVALTNWGESHIDDNFDPLAQLRSEQLHTDIQRTLKLASSSQILDYGGGQGRLMKAFRTAGHQAFLVDYHPHPVDWLVKLGNTLEDLRPEVSFDLVIASHVLEHVAEPTKTLRQLASHIRDDGHIFVEVPMEIWGSPPLQGEPVTHINFFVPGSLCRCLEEAGFDVMSCRFARTPYAIDGFNLTVQAIGKKCNDSGSPQATGVGEVEAFLTPSLQHRVRRRITLSGSITGMLSYLVLERSYRHRLRTTTPVID